MSILSHKVGFDCRLNSRLQSEPNLSFAQTPKSVLSPVLKFLKGMRVPIRRSAGKFFQKVSPRNIFPLSSHFPHPPHLPQSPQHMCLPRRRLRTSVTMTAATTAQRSAHISSHPILAESHESIVNLPFTDQTDLFARTTRPSFRGLLINSMYTMTASTTSAKSMPIISAAPCTAPVNSFPNWLTISATAYAKAHW